ncbi:MAG: hypothetical protein CENE_01976 [Candidatus Celerinatantimonas neptuna]|nr:MAG: hypothetical protein CENE_01491 [Candidatus Celerinatantimonas neptuna]CAG8999990.1 MAG: hypothetical protein CENE_01976 [Candidatus Celerinatantimonas neptuna]
MLFNNLEKLKRLSQEYEFERQQVFLVFKANRIGDMDFIQPYVR